MSSIEQNNADELARLKGDIGNDLVALLKKTLKEEGKDVFGQAIDSIQYFDDDNIVGSILDYVYNIEFGREAGSHVPLEPLKKWAVEKLGIPEDEAWAVARKIENKIYEEGIDMTRFAKISLDRFGR